MVSPSTGRPFFVSQAEYGLSFVCHESTIKGLDRTHFYKLVDEESGPLSCVGGIVGGIVGETILETRSRGKFDTK